MVDAILPRHDIGCQRDTRNEKEQRTHLNDLGADICGYRGHLFSLNQSQVANKE